MSPRRKAILMLVLTAVLWSSSGLFVKLLSWGPLAILGARSLVASTLFLVYLRPKSLRFTWLQLAGGVAYMGAQGFFIAGTKITAAANVIFLSYTAPLYIVLLGYWLLKERPHRADWLTMPVIFGGMLLFFAGNFSGAGLLGNIWGALSGLCLALMTLALRRQKQGEPAHAILAGNLMGALLGLPFVLSEAFVWVNAGIILYLGLFQIGLSFLLFSAAIKHLEALETSLISTIEPILNPIWVFLVLGETPGSWALLGGLLVIVGVVLRAALSATANRPLRVRRQPI